MGAVLAAAAPTLIKTVAGLLGSSGPHPLDAGRKAILDGYAQTGNVPALVAWIQDVPPHPISSVQYAQALLSRMTGAPYQTGGRIARPAVQTYPTAGYIPVQAPGGTVVGIPYVTGS
jgi:hypothetical protein